MAPLRNYQAAKFGKEVPFGASMRSPDPGPISRKVSQRLRLMMRCFLVSKLVRGDEWEPSQKPKHLSPKLRVLAHTMV
jgi:hypothetical protein